jgi:hypothetical protein
MLAELNEVEILTLKMYELHGENRNNFIKKHNDALNASQSFFGAPLADIEKKHNTPDL